MGLEDAMQEGNSQIDIAGTPSVNISIKRVYGIKQLEKNVYEIAFGDNCNPLLDKRKHQAFVEGLKVGDYLLEVTRGTTTVMYYGPVDPKRFCNPGE